MLLNIGGYWCCPVLVPVVCRWLQNVVVTCCCNVCLMALMRVDVAVVLCCVLYGVVVCCCLMLYDAYWRDLMLQVV